MRSLLHGAIATIVATVGLSGGVAAHPLAPSLFEVSELAAGRIELVWKTPRLQPRGATLEPVLPERCVPTGPPRVEREGAAVLLRWSAECGSAGLVGAEFHVTGLAASGTDVLLRIVPREGPPIQALLSAGRDRFSVPEQQDAAEVARDYLGLGFEHIIGGLDHLLFVLGLVLLIPGWRRLVPVVTAFTVGHSVTLALVTLGVVRLSQGPVEIAIAASILVLAVRLCRDGAASDPARVPIWTLAGAFGLLHGLGFAGALADIGLPAAEIPLALLAFNVGIELAQLSFVAVLLALGASIRWLPSALPRSWVRVPAYAMGSLAAFWCLQRTTALISP
jgi:hydrogenase/urease accessory protein HupE